MKQLGKRDEFEELNFKTTEEIKVPEKLIDQVIGQEKAKKIIRKAAIQRRHVLLIGKPGTGKSMLAKAMAEILPPTQLEDILVFPNERDPYQPIIKTVPAGEGKKIVEEYRRKALLSLDTQLQRKQLIAFLIILFVAFFLQFFIKTETNPVLEAANRISTTLFLLFFMLFISLAMYTPKLIPIHLQIKRREPKIIVDNSNRKTAPFVDATGAHEGALLGDVLHDPYQSFSSVCVFWVIDKRKNRIYLTNISDFVNRMIKKYPERVSTKEIDGSLYIAVDLSDKDYYTFTVKDNKIVETKIISVNKRIGNFDVVPVEYKNFFILLTKEHEIYTKKGILEAGKYKGEPLFTFDMPLLREEDIVMTYGEKELKKYRQYLKWLEFKREHPNIGWKKAAKILKIPESMTRWWDKGMKPSSLRVIDQLRELNLIPLYLSDPRLPIISRIYGYALGDGNIDRNLNLFSIVSSQKEVLERVIEDLKRVFGEFTYEIRENTSSRGKSYIFRTAERRIIRFFVALGYPVGKKTTKEIKIPEFILLRKDTIIEFLRGLFDSDGSVFSFGNKTYLEGNLSFLISCRRDQKLINNRIEFLNEIKLLLECLGVEVNSINRKDYDSGVMFRLLISHKLDNVKRFYKLLAPSYNIKKANKLRKGILYIENHRSRVYSRKYIPPDPKVKETYNITTETGNLIVNGILVKNSGGLETPPHLRVVAGAIHKAHKGVLYIDEIATLKPEMQIELLTAMQEKKYPITGRSPRSAGALVQTTPAPCDFILVAAGTPETIQYLHPALRSRIQGYGYEVYMEDKMPDTPENRKKLAQFVAQEVVRDGNIPHFTREAVIEIIKEARRRAGAKGYLTLQLRDLAGLVRAAGDLAKERGHKYVLPEDVIDAKEIAASVEEQYAKRYTEIAKRYMVIETKGSKVGKVNGLALISTSPTSTTEVGIIQPIEATVTPGSERGKIKVIATGKLGEIAKEAVQNVFAIIKKYREEKEYDVHIQFLQTYGGVEGDSGSIAIATAVISALEGIPVKQDVAMTGSLSVLGEVLPVGGVNGKIKAAIEAGIKTVIIPYKNLDDITLSKKELEKVKIVPVRNLCDVLKIALVDCRKKKEVIDKIKNVIEIDKN